MIFFCEECGGQINMDEATTTDTGMLKCPLCSEVLTTRSSGDGKSSQPFSGIAEAQSGNGKVKLLVVDDSKLIRKAIRRIFETDDGLKVVGEAGNGEEALQMIPELSPDVVTLDINMPVMDGLTALKHIMIQSPTPTVMFSSLTKEGATETFDALRFGAVDFLNKPSQFNPKDLHLQHKAIINKVKTAAHVRTDAIRLIRSASKSTSKKNGASDLFDFSDGRAGKICILGAAEGGYGALLQTLPGIKPDGRTAFIVVLYASETYMEAFADYLDAACAINVKRAKDGDVLYSDVCYVAAGSEYVVLEETAMEPVLRVSAAPFPEKRGAINILMLSASELESMPVVGVVLSGEGEDAVEGTEEILSTGGRAVIQAPETCLFKTMSTRSIERCPDALVAPIGRMAEQITQALR